MLLMLPPQAWRKRFSSADANILYKFFFTCSLEASTSGFAAPTRLNHAEKIIFSLIRRLSRRGSDR